MPWLCGIYEERPDLCRRYPEPGSFIPKSCGFSFQGDGKRSGRCEPGCGASCCRLPRVGGGPEATSLPEAAGGLPCRHLVFTDKDIKFSGERVEEAPGIPSPQPDTAELEV
jgi:Fe-S-cluster containining protein